MFSMGLFIVVLTITCYAYALTCYDCYNKTNCGDILANHQESNCIDGVTQCGNILYKTTSSLTLYQTNKCVPNEEDFCKTEEENAKKNNCEMMRCELCDFDMCNKQDLNPDIV